MRALQDVLTWSVMMVLLTGLLPGITGAILARNRKRGVEYARSVARWLATALSLAWWFVAMHGLHLAFSLDWVGAALSTPVRVLAFTAWCLSPGYLAPAIAERSYSKGFRETS